MRYALAMLCLLAFPAAAQVPVCGTYEQIKGYLSAKPYEEQPVMMGMGGTDEQPITVYFWVNRSTRSWTVVAVQPSGHACITAAGNNLRPAPAPLKPGNDL